MITSRRAMVLDCSLDQAISQAFVIGSERCTVFSFHPKAFHSHALPKSAIDIQTKIWGAMEFMGVAMDFMGAAMELVLPDTFSRVSMVLSMRAFEPPSKDRLFKT